jgi:hypothetical protein
MADSILFLASFIAFAWLSIWSTRAPKSGGWSPFDMNEADEPPPPPPKPPRFGRPKPPTPPAGRPR